MAVCQSVCYLYKAIVLAMETQESISESTNDAVESATVSDNSEFPSLL